MIVVTVVAVVVVVEVVANVREWESSRCPVPWENMTFASSVVLLYRNELPQCPP